MELNDLGYSLNNIPVPLKSSYLKSMMKKLVNFTKNIRWKSYFFNNFMMHGTNNYTKHSFRSNILPQSLFEMAFKTWGEK